MEYEKCSRLTDGRYCEEHRKMVEGTMSGTAVTLMCIRSTEERGDKSCHNKIHYEMGD